MSKHLMDVEINALEHDENGDRLIVKRTVQVKVDDDYQIDGVSMPTPNYVKVTAETMSESKRLPGNGLLVSEYIGTANNVTWRYSKINGAEYKLLKDACVGNTIKNKDIFHSVKTLDPYDLEIKNLTLYCNSSFGHEPYMNKDGLFIYRDVVIELVDRAGEV